MQSTLQANEKGCRTEQTNQAFEYIIPHLDNRGLLLFSQACSSTRTLTKQAREERVLSHLLQAVVQGNQTEAERVLALEPKLLLKATATAEDYSGKLIKNLAPFQAALCAGDVEMSEMMKPYFAKLENGQAEIEKQFKGVFPSSSDEEQAFLQAHAESQKQAAFDFSEIVEAIVNASPDEVTTALARQYDDRMTLHKALSNFRQVLQDISYQDQVFNTYHLLSALQCYADRFDALGPDWDKRDLFWRQIVGFTQRYLPACYLQACAQGFYYIVEHGETLTRSFDFRHGGGSIRDLVWGAGLGFDWARGSLGGGPYARAVWRVDVYAGDVVIKIMSTKNIKLGSITRPATQRLRAAAHRACVI